MKAAGKKLSQKAAQRLAEKGMEKQARRWAVTHVFTEMQRQYRTAMKAIEKYAAIDITAPTQFFFKSGKMGRESFRRFTTLEARVFMRGDAKVFVHVDRLACTKAKEYLNGWLKEQARDIVTDAVEHQRWQKNVSAWWLLNSGDSVDLQVQTEPAIKK